MYKISLLPKAQNDIKEVAFWYNTKKKGLGKSFVKNLREELNYISKNPFLFANRYKKIHTAVVKYFPYMIHYQIDEVYKSVLIIAVFHTSLNPKTNWDKRV